MTPWTPEAARQSIYAFDSYMPEQQALLLNYLNVHFPPSVYEHHRACKERAVANTIRSKKILSGADQVFPTVVRLSELPLDPESLKQCAIVLMAGGEGERLRLSLQARGVSELSLNNFTKATYPLTDFYKDFGTLQANLCVITSLAKKYGAALPVAVTTGPAGSVTARVIPELLAQHEYFGHNALSVIAQEERLHLTQDNKIVCILDNGTLKPVTNPDETGGPIMQLKKPIDGGESFLSRAARMGCTKVLILQATGLYDPQIIPAMAAAIAHRDCVGVGILRSSFPDNDPYGTYVVVEKDGDRKVVIVEPEIRNDTTRSLTNDTGGYLPYNTGLYAFDASLLQAGDLPDYATPAKEIIPGLQRAPKVGYAATDLFALAQNAAVLSVPAQSFGVIKNADDLGRVAQLGKHLGIDMLCGGF
jgi:hypothetical protein